MQNQAKTALSNEKFRELARKIEPNVDVKYPRVSSEQAGGEAGSGVVGLLHSELEKEVSEQKQDAMLSEELKDLIARAKSPQFLNHEAKLAAAHLLAHQVLPVSANAVGLRMRGACVSQAGVRACAWRGGASDDGCRRHVALVGEQELQEAKDTVSDILPPPTSQPEEAGTKNLLPTLIKQLQASNDADSKAP